MKKKKVITLQVALVLTTLLIFNISCGLIDAIGRALAGYCESPEWVVTRFDDPARLGLCTADDCSLRTAVQNANSCPGTQTVRLPAGTYVLSLAGTDEDANRTGDLDITGSLNIISSGEAVIDGGGLDRVLDIFSPAAVTLTSISITNGSWVDGGGLRNAGALTMQGGVIRGNAGRRGGGLFNSGTAALDSVAIQDNLAERGFGSGIYNEGSLHLVQVALLRNTGLVDVQGGGLFNTGTAVLEDVNLEANSVDLQGGGIYSTGSLTMTGGFVQKNMAGSSGGGLYNHADGSLVLTGVTIAENQLGTLVDPFGLPAGAGAGLENDGEAVITGCLITRNQAGHARGGGIANFGTLTMHTTTVEWNTALQGAGLANFAIALVDASTFSDNTVTGFEYLAGIGAGIDNYYQASLTLTNSTLSRNVAVVSSGPLAFRGAGLYNEGVAELSSVTVTGNAPDGLYSNLPGIEGEPVGPPATKLKNTIIAGNTVLDCNGDAILSQGFNLDGDNTCLLTAPGDLPGWDPRLAPLASNGGPTLTHALQPDSPAVDQGGACPATDQRGFPRPRPIGGACDIGAYELDPANVNVPPAATPAAAAASAPVFTFDQEANCRLGPNTLYASVGYGRIGQQARIEGLSDPAGWYYVLLPDGLTRCFVAGSTGTLTGPVDGLPVIPAPPLPPAAPVLSVSNQVCDSKRYVVHLSWNDVQGEAGYRVYRDGSLITTLGPDAASYDDTSPDYESHAYRVEAYNDSGTAASSLQNSAGCLY